MRTRIARRYGGGCVDIYAGPFLLSVIYRRNAGRFGWMEDWPIWRIMLAKAGVVFGRWDREDYYP